MVVWVPLSRFLSQCNLLTALCIGGLFWQTTLHSNNQFSPLKRTFLLLIKPCFNSICQGSLPAPAPQGHSLILMAATSSPLLGLITVSAIDTTVAPINTNYFWFTAPTLTGTLSTSSDTIYNPILWSIVHGNSAKLDATTGIQTVVGNSGPPCKSNLLSRAREPKDNVEAVSGSLKQCSLSEGNQIFEVVQLLLQAAALEISLIYNAHHAHWHIDKINMSYMCERFFVPTHYLSKS